MSAPIPDKKPGRLPRATTRIATAFPGGIAVLLLVGAVAFGGTVLRPALTEHPDDPAVAAHQPAASAVVERAGDPSPLSEPSAGADPTAVPEESDEPEPTATAEAVEATAEPTAEPTAKPTPKPTPKPTAKPKPKETATPAPKPTTLALKKWVKEDRVKLSWTAYSGAGFEYYKVVRSGDASASWPLAENDELVGVITDPGATTFADEAPCEIAWHYRVFAVSHTDSGYKVLAASNTVTASVGCPPEATPAPVESLGLELKVADGGIRLEWTMCGNDDFVAYKVVRSQTNSDPRYPLNDGTELIGVIGEQAVVSVVDTDVQAGETWTYRVECVGKDPHGDYVVLGESEARAATVPAGA
jgi:hypothetical protein